MRSRWDPDPGPQATLQCWCKTTILTTLVQTAFSVQQQTAFHIAPTQDPSSDTAMQEPKVTKSMLKSTATHARHPPDPHKPHHRVVPSLSQSHTICKGLNRSKAHSFSGMQCRYTLEEGLVGKKPTVCARRRLILKHGYCPYTALQEGTGVEAAFCSHLVPLNAVTTLTVVLLQLATPSNRQTDRDIYAYISTIYTCMHLYSKDTCIQTHSIIHS